MSKNSCVAAEEHGTCVLRMARVNCNKLYQTQSAQRILSLEVYYADNR